MTAKVAYKSSQGTLQSQEENESIYEIRKKNHSRK